MKIRRKRDTTYENGLSVTGPGVDEKKRYPSTGSALSYAQGLATGQDAPSTHTVIEYEDVIFRVHRDENGVITTTRGEP